MSNLTPHQLLDFPRNKYLENYAVFLSRHTSGEHPILLPELQSDHEQFFRYCLKHYPGTPDPEPRPGTKDLAKMVKEHGDFWKHTTASWERDTGWKGKYRSLRRYELDPLRKRREEQWKISKERSSKLRTRVSHEDEEPHTQDDAAQQKHMSIMEEVLKAVTTPSNPKEKQDPRQQ